MKALPEPCANKMSGSCRVHTQSSMDRKAKSKKVKGAEDALQGSNQKRAHLRASKSFGDNAPGGPQKRAPPKSTRSLDEDIRINRGTNGFDKVPRSSETGADHKVQRNPAPPASRLKKTQRRARMDSSAKSKKVKGAEDALQGSNQKRAQLRASKSFGDDTPGGPHKRAPLKATQSLDGNEFRRKLVKNQIPYIPSEVGEGTEQPDMAFKAAAVNENGHRPHTSPLAFARTDRQGRSAWLSQYRIPYLDKVNTAIPYLVSIDDDNDTPVTAYKDPTSAKSENTSPAALARVMTAQPESSGTTMSRSACVKLQSFMDRSTKSKKVKKTEGVLPGKNQKRAQLRASKSFGDDPPRGPQKRAPPNATRSLGKNEFRRKLVQNKIPSPPSDVDELNGDVLPARSSSLDMGDDALIPKIASALAA
jgi:hypothetical protein